MSDGGSEQWVSQHVAQEDEADTGPQLGIIDRLLREDRASSSTGYEQPCDSGGIHRVKKVKNLRGKKYRAVARSLYMRQVAAQYWELHAQYEELPRSYNLLTVQLDSVLSQ